MLSESSILTVSKNCTWKELAGNIVILQTSTHPPVTHELNSTSSFVWNFLQNGDKPYSELLDVFLSEFDVGKNQAEQDLKELLEKLQSKDLLCIQN